MIHIHSKTLQSRLKQIYDKSFSITDEQYATLDNLQAQCDFAVLISEPGETSYVSLTIDEAYFLNNLMHRN